MEHPKLNAAEIAKLGEQIYASQLAAKIGTDANRGRLLSIDVETGDYEIGDDDSIEAPLRLHARHPGAAVYTLRIGYNAAVTLGGILEPIGCVSRLSFSLSTPRS